MRARLLSAAVLLSTALGGCGGGSESTSGSKVSIAMPPGVQAKDFPGTGVVTASANIDGGPPTPLEVNVLTNTISGRIDMVATGDRTLNIIIDFMDDLFGPVSVAAAAKPITVVPGDTQIDLTDNDYALQNSDTDAYPNLLELQARTDPFDPASLPGVGGLPGGGYWKSMLWGQTNWR
ncbi:MAG: hypothetical protein ACR2RB_08850 [Gammaproteobacteria bacterium]